MVNDQNIPQMASNDFSLTQIVAPFRQESLFFDNPALPLEKTLRHDPNFRFFGDLEPREETQALPDASFKWLDNVTMLPAMNIEEAMMLLTKKSLTKPTLHDRLTENLSYVAKTAKAAVKSVLDYVTSPLKLYLSKRENTPIASILRETNTRSTLEHTVTTPIAKGTLEDTTEIVQDPQVIDELPAYKSQEYFARQKDLKNQREDHIYDLIKEGKLVLAPAKMKNGKLRYSYNKHAIQQLAMAYSVSEKTAKLNARKMQLEYNRVVQSLISQKEIYSNDLANVA